MEQDLLDNMEYLLDDLLHVDMEQAIVVHKQQQNSKKQLLKIDMPSKVLFYALKLSGLTVLY
jgi:hypothetical protein